jgi:ABC-type branched-subunit amino acid transport system ATPase component
MLLTEKNALIIPDTSDRANVIYKESIVYKGGAEYLRKNEEMIREIYRSIDMLWI